MRSIYICLAYGAIRDAGDLTGSTIAIATSERMIKVRPHNHVIFMSLEIYTPITFILILVIISHCTVIEEGNLCVIHLFCMLVALAGLDH